MRPLQIVGGLALDVDVGRTVARVSVEEHMANYQAARALMGKGRNAGEGAAELSKSSAKNGGKKSAVKKRYNGAVQAEAQKEVTPSPTPISDFSVSAFRVSAFPLSPIRRWFR